MFSPSTYRLFAAIALATYIIFTWPTEGAQEIKLTLLHRVLLERKPVTATVKLKPHEGNRWVTLLWDAEAAAGSSSRQLEGREPEIVQFTIPPLPPGIYFIESSLTRVEGGKRKIHTDHTWLTVCGPGVDSCSPRGGL